MTERREVRWSSLAARGDALQIDGDEVPVAEITEAAIAQRRRIPDGARVVVASEHPSDYWYLMPLFGLLSLFALLFLWAFVRSVRSERAAAASAA